MSANVASRQRAALALLLLVPIPTIAVVWSVVAEPGAASERATAFYLASKVWIVALPFAWRRFVDRRPASLSAVTRHHLYVGALVGVGMVAAIVLVRFLLGVEWLDGAALRENLARSGVDTAAEFVAMAVGLSLVNALLEEIVWRWFVVEKWSEALPARASVWCAPLAAACFTAHHVAALTAHFGLLVTVLASLGVFAGGWIWSVLYRRTGSIWPGYVAHVLVDACLMTIGYGLLFH